MPLADLPAAVAVLGRPRVKVAVCVMTYNQRDFIAPCLDSLVAQSLDEPFELLVMDDCSTDGTSDVVADYARRFGERVVHLRQPRNLGPYLNYQLVHELACQRGEYVAHVDGDDLAFPGKLAAQVLLLDANPDVALSAHAVQVIGQERVIGNAPDLPEWGTRSDLLRLGTYFTNSSTMYRAQNRFDHGPNLDIIDFYMHLEQASRGRVHLNKQALGAYRWHSGGISKSAAHKLRIERAYELAFRRALELGASREDVTEGLLRRRKSFALASLVEGDLAAFRERIRVESGAWRHATAVHLGLSIGRHLIRGPVVKCISRRLSK